MARKTVVDIEKPGKFSALLTGLVDVISEGFSAELKMPAENARKAAEMAMEIIYNHSAGSALYIAKGHLWAVTEKHRRIYRRFTGANHTQLAREFDLTSRQIYSIIAMVGQEEFEKKQCKLPGM
ncbi:MAG: hypothetical protein PVSMB11_13410 [Desulfuromonadaceae bacterium]